MKAMNLTNTINNYFYIINCVISIGDSGDVLAMPILHPSAQHVRPPPPRL